MFVEHNHPAKPKLVKCIRCILRVNLAEKGGLLVESNNFEPVTMKNLPELSLLSTDAPDASSITARLPALDPNLAAVLIQEKQYGLLETLMNNPQQLSTHRVV
jgi:hypothetical protein